MRLSWLRCQGMTLLELLIALALGAGLSAVIMQLFTGSMRLQSVQRSEQDLQQRAAYAQFILRASILESAAPCAAGEVVPTTGAGPGIEILAANTGSVSALAGSHVLRLRTSDCEEPVHFLYIARRSSAGQPAGLYRRRLRSDGTLSAAEELIEGVTAMTATVGVELLPVAPEPASELARGADHKPVDKPRVAYVSVDQVGDWSRVFSVNLTLSVQQVMISGEAGSGGLTMTFSTALRQSELHGRGQRAI